MKVYNICKDYTMTSKERMYALYNLVRYVINQNIDGDFVECGIWKGGSCMLIAHTLLKMGVTNRHIYLYDTFKGMTIPTKYDKLVSNDKVYAKDKWHKNIKDDGNEWCYVSLDEVQKNMKSTEYPVENIHYIKGDVQQTIPKHSSTSISLLRLDTDWYESTKHELEQLYPLISIHGVLIVDDYGHWAGSKKAVDEYFNEKNVLFNRIDYCGISHIKMENGKSN
jgi:hypothetical protein